MTSATLLRIKRILPDLLAFAFGLTLAYLGAWNTADLVWGLWLSSLIVGYLTILSAIAGAIHFGSTIIRHPNFPPEQRRRSIFFGVFIVLLLLGFFSLHFCGFHAGHSIFLQQFFPLSGVPRDGFGDAFANPVLLWTLVFQHLLYRYGLFLLPVIIAERSNIAAPLLRALRAPRPEVVPGGKLLNSASPGAIPQTKSQNWFDDAFIKPYTNIVRMHLLIFFFAFCSALNFDSFLVYVVVYGVYFFPWREFRAARTEKPSTYSG